MASTLFSGFALAAGPAVATAIATDDKGLVAGQVRIPVQGGDIPAYRAAPAGKAATPVVLVVQEIFGVHEYIKDVCRRLAKAGYMAIAPELYSRQGDPGKYTDVAQLIREVVNKVPDPQVMSDLDATVAWAGKNGGGTDKLGITGFCWGGRIVWLYAAHNPAVDAGVAWYGRLVGSPDALHPSQPVDIAAKLHGPVLGLSAGKDAGITQDTNDQTNATLTQG